MSAGQLSQDSGMDNVESRDQRRRPRWFDQDEDFTRPLSLGWTFQAAFLYISHSLCRLYMIFALTFCDRQLGVRCAWRPMKGRVLVLAFPFPARQALNAGRQ